MKNYVFAVLTLFTSISAYAEPKQEYLACHGQHDSTWRGYTVAVKFLSNDKAYGVLLKQKPFSKDKYTAPFVVTVEKNENQSTTYSNSEQGIEFTVYKDSYSGVLRAEALHRSFTGPSVLLCDYYTNQQFYYWFVDSKNAHDTDLTNVKALYRMK